MKAKLKQVATHRVSLFAFVGVINTLLDFVLLNILRVIFHVTSDQSTKVIILNLVSASCVAVFSFYINRRYVFKSEETRHRMIVPFLAITITGIFILQSLIIALSLRSLEPLARWLYDLFSGSPLPIIKNFSLNFYEVNLAKVVATFASMIWNYTLYKKMIFKSVEK
jgi:putative flippase GtrA